MSFEYYFTYIHKFILRPVVAQGHTVWLLNRLVVGSVPTRGDEIFTSIYILISSLWCRGQVRRWILPLNTQCFQNSADSGERSALTLGKINRTAIKVFKRRKLILKFTIFRGRLNNVLYFKNGDVSYNVIYKIIFLVQKGLLADTCKKYHYNTTRILNNMINLICKTDRLRKLVDKGHWNLVSYFEKFSKFLWERTKL